MKMLEVNDAKEEMPQTPNSLVKTSASQESTASPESSRRGLHRVRSGSSLAALVLE